MSRTANTFTVTLTDGRVILYSYDVPVAVFIPGRGAVKTSAHYSTTTSRHANTFCRENSRRDVAPVEVPAVEFAALIDPIEVPR